MFVMNGQMIFKHLTIGQLPMVTVQTPNMVNVPLTELIQMEITAQTIAVGLPFKNNKKTEGDSMAVINILKDGTVVTDISNVYVPKEIVERVVDISRRKHKAGRGKNEA